MNRIRHIGLKITLGIVTFSFAIEEIAAQDSLHVTDSVKAVAPNELTSPEIRQRCEALAEFLRSALPTKPTPGKAINISPDSILPLSRCNVSAGKVLPTIWRHAVSDSAMLTNLMIASVSVKDRRIEDTLVAILFDRTRPARVRIGALYTLRGYEEKTVGYVSLVPPTLKRSSDGTVIVDTTVPKRWIVLPRNFGSNVQQIEGVESLGPKYFVRYKANVLKLVNTLYPDEKGRFRTEGDEEVYFRAKSVYEAYLPRSRFAL